MSLLERGPDRGDQSGQNGSDRTMAVAALAGEVLELKRPCLSRDELAAAIARLKAIHPAMTPHVFHTACAALRRYEGNADAEELSAIMLGWTAGLPSQTRLGYLQSQARLQLQAGRRLSERMGAAIAEAAEELRDSDPACVLRAAAVLSGAKHHAIAAALAFRDVDALLARLNTAQTPVQTGVWLVKSLRDSWRLAEAQQVLAGPVFANVRLATYRALSAFLALCTGAAPTAESLCHALNGLEIRPGKTDALWLGLVLAEFGQCDRVAAELSRVCPGTPFQVLLAVIGLRRAGLDRQARQVAAEHAHLLPAGCGADICDLSPAAAGEAAFLAVDANGDCAVPFSFQVNYIKLRLLNPRAPLAALLASEYEARLPQWRALPGGHRLPQPDRVFRLRPGPAAERQGVGGRG